MHVTISSIFTGEVYDIQGNPMEVEEKVRRVFRGVMNHVPHGDLESVLDVANRMHGYMVKIHDAVDFAPPARERIRRPSFSDPWVREIDTDLPPSSNKA